MGAFFSHLECSIPCGAGPSDPRHVHQRCVCGAPLLARYDLTAAKRWPRSTLGGREASMWRYRDLLPLLQSSRGLDPPVTLGEGWTPLLRARRLGSTLGLKRLYLKDESLNPTGSWKARGMATLFTRALHLGVKRVGVTGDGRLAHAAAAYAARAAIELNVVLSDTDHMPGADVVASLHGAKVSTIEGSAEEAERHLARQVADQGWFDASAGAEPYRLEGQKTIGYEVAEQLGWQIPDWIVCPAATGVTLVGLAKAFVEMAALGWIDPVRRPHLVAVQAAGCAPLVRAFGAGAPDVERWTALRTAANDLRVLQPPAGALALKAIKESGGTATGVGDVEMAKEVRLIASLEGLSPAPGAGAAMHAVRVLASEGRIKPHDTVVVINPGSAADLPVPR